jgi:predicted DNA-binding transcriptional regulator AlpA
MTTTNLPTLIGTDGIAKMLGLDRAYVTDRLTKRPDFPRPALDLSRKTRRWDKTAIEVWMQQQAARAAARRR